MNLVFTLPSQTEKSGNHAKVMSIAMPIQETRSMPKGLHN